MQHDLTISGPAFRLRPIANSDADVVLKLRRNPTLNRYLHATPQSVRAQMEWLAAYYERPHDYYFAIERLRTSRVEGVISIYDIDPTFAIGEWGRWILTPDSLAAVESAWLIYRLAFEQLGLQHVVCRTVFENSKVVSFHDSCGIRLRRLLPGHFHLNGQSVDAIEHRVNRLDWPEIAPNLENLAQRIARRIHRE